MLRGVLKRRLTASDVPWLVDAEPPLKRVKIETKKEESHEDEHDSRNDGGSYESDASTDGSDDTGDTAPER